VHVHGQTEDTNGGLEITHGGTEDANGGTEDSNGGTERRYQFVIAKLKSFLIKEGPLINLTRTLMDA
jgi:hypothetical protein